MRNAFALFVFAASSSLSPHAVAQVAPVNMVALEAEVETVYTLPDGREVRTSGHLYRSRTGQIREDSPLGAVITDVANGTITVLVSARKEARVITIPPERRARAAGSTPPAPEVFEEATVGGHRITKARTRGPQGQAVEFWTAGDLGVVIRTKAQGAGLTAIRELRNISTREPDPALFTIPPGFTVIQQEARPDDRPEGLLPLPDGANPPTRLR